MKDVSPRWVSLRLGEALAWWRGRALADFGGTTPEGNAMMLRSRMLEHLYVSEGGHVH